MVRCDAPAWTLFGISLAGYNAIASLAIGVFAFRPIADDK
jgi:disulfide bond formation protein DsbB